MKKGTAFTELVFLWLVLLLPAFLHAQVNSQEVLQNQQNNAVPVMKQKEKQAPVAAEAEGITAATMNEAGYLAMYKKLRKDALAASHYRVPAAKQQQLDQVVAKLGALNAKSFEYHYASWLNNRFDTAAGYHLLEAWRLAPGYKELLPELTLFYEIKGESAKQLQYCRQIQQQNLYGTFLYSYAGNLLKSVEQGAFLVTQGEWDTQPLWVLQKVKGVRADVTILQMELLQKESYFNRMMTPFKLKKGAYKRFITDQAAFFRELASTTQNKPVYLSLTIDRIVLEKIGNNLYTTGLAMKLTDTPFNNVAILNGNWKTFDVQNLQPEKNQTELGKMAGNYLLPLGLMYQYEIQEGNEDAATKIKQQMTDIASRAGKTAELEKFFRTEQKK
jgi:hypothetical protein